MKVFLTLALLAVAITALPIEENDNRVNGETGWYVPQIDGSYKWLDKDEAEALLAQMSAERSILSSSVNFYLYTQSNPSTPHEITESEASISASPFNANNPTRFIIHGWGGSYTDSMNRKIRDAWFTHGDFNIIVVDWSRGRSLDYASSVIAIPKTGEKIGSLIDFLHNNHGLSLETLDVIGHSLGAHVAGFTGKNVQSGQVHNIVGLDPALPLFSFDKPSGRLASTDGFYVESIQTNGGQLGFLKPIGKGSFYPNGGKIQPGCGVDLTGSCSHGRSVTYYIEAVQIDDFPSMKCESYEDAVDKDCGTTYSSVRMGAVTNAYFAAGDFYVPVNEESPFGMGI